MNCPICQRQMVPDKMGLHCPIVDAKDHMYVWAVEGAMYIYHGFAALVYPDDERGSASTTIYKWDVKAGPFDDQSAPVWSIYGALDFPAILRVIQQLEETDKAKKLLN